MNEKQAEPLTPEEIEDIRVRGSNLALVDPRFYSLWDVINRLLATLDAAREQRDRWEAEARHQFDLRDDAARTASVAGLDRERLADRIDTFCSACEGDRYLVTADPEDDGQPGDPYQVQCLDSIHACADMVRAAPSIEQEPGEALGNDKGPVYASARRIESILDEAVLSGALTAAERNTFTIVERAALREQEPGETLRAAAWRLSNAAESLALHASHPDDPAHRYWFLPAIGDVEREVRLARAAAGREPTPDEYRLAIEADRNPQETK